MDFPLTVDLPDPNIPRCYFVPDARGDAFGTKKILEGGSGHMKSLHLRPLLSAAQRRTDAIALAIYREKDALPKEADSLASHFVMPVDVDSLWVGERRVQINPGAATEAPVKPGESVALAKGAATVGVRVVWGRDVEGKASSVRLVYDPNESKVAMRLTVTHHVSPGPQSGGRNAGAAFWVRVGSGLKDDAARDAWRKQFAAAQATVEATAERVKLVAAGVDGPLSVEAASPFAESVAVDPPWSKAVLELDGEDLGKGILKSVVPATTATTGK
jgi:hypothetical protein